LIEVRLFGDLRRYATGSASESGTVLYLSGDDSWTLGQVLATLEIEPAEVSNVFLNGRLLPRSLYPITLGYPLASESPLTQEGYVNTPIRAGDRLGIFPRNMGVVVV
jgi:hypothetical protein